MRRVVAACLLVLLAATAAGAQHFLQATAHITTQTTTTVRTNTGTIGGRATSLAIMAGSICVDAGGATTAITIQDSAGLNLFGTGITWAIPAGSCLNFPYQGFPFGVPTGAGKDLQVVTGTGNGPVEVTLQVTNQ